MCQRLLLVTIQIRKLTRGDIMLFGSNFLSIGRTSQLSFLKKESQVQNRLVFEELFNRYSNLAITRFDWTGLPDSVDERFLNTVLYLYGSVAFFNHPDMGLVALPCTPQEYNIYYNPITAHAYSFNFERYLDNRDPERQFVYVRNNPSATPTAFPIFIYTERMADILRTIDVLNKKQKNPYFFMCEEKERVTIQNMVKNILDNDTVVLGNKALNIKDNQLKLEQSGIPTDLSSCWDNFHSYESMVYTILGIESLDTRKKERQIVDEVQANNMVTQMCSEVNIKELQQGCDRVNEMFGTDIWVEAKSLIAYKEEVDNVGEIYGGTGEAGSGGV